MLLRASFLSNSRMLSLFFDYPQTRSGGDLDTEDEDVRAGFIEVLARSLIDDKIKVGIRSNAAPTQPDCSVLRPTVDRLCLPDVEPA